MKLLHSFNEREITEVDYELPEMTDDQVMVKTIMCGICRSDIGSYMRWEGMMTLGQFGHEGLGQIIKVGKNIIDAKEGDYVATWSDPAYGDYYYAKQNEFSIIPEPHFKYIMQPVACAINIIEKTKRMADTLGYDSEKILLLGTGYMSLVIGQLLKPEEVDIVGNSNKDYWNKLGHTLYSNIESLPKEKYKVIIDLTSKEENFYKITKLAALEALICYAATPYTPVKTNFFENCWNCHTFIMPSPRNSDFKDMMDMGIKLVSTGVLNTELLWSKSYKRSDIKDIKQGFEDGVTRTPEYIRGYINWNE